MTIAPEHLIIYGDPKCGKSTLVSKLSENYNLLWFSIDMGHSVIDKLPQVWRDRIIVQQFFDTYEFPVAIETCRALIKGNKLQLCPIHGKHKCMNCAKVGRVSREICLLDLPDNTIIVFDNVSELCESALNYAFAQDKDTKGKEAPKADYDIWAQQGWLMNDFLRTVEKFPVPIICIAHTYSVTMEDNKKKLAPHIGTTNFSTGAGKYFDHMIYMEVSNKKHVAGSSSTYHLSAITGSRKDVVIEGQKELSLLPFFDGTIGKPGAKDAHIKSSNIIVNQGTVATNSGTATSSSIADRLAKMRK